MIKGKVKKGLKVIIIIGCILFVVKSVFNQLEYKHHINNVNEINYSRLTFIGVMGKNLANRLEQFLALVEEPNKTETLHKQLADNWRVVSGESKQIYGENIILKTMYLNKEERYDMSLMQFNLNRVDSYISGMTISFLEQQSFEIKEEEREILQAIVNFYKAYSNINEKEEVDLADIQSKVKPYMLIIYDDYEFFLEFFLDGIDK